jgi:flagellar motor switch protein FliM
MAELLSQNEIDNLLSALSSGEIDIDEIPKAEEKQKVKNYDFRSPQKFSKDAIRTLELIHDNYARIISNYLSAQVRSNVKVTLESISQITYEEFMHSISNPTILIVFKMSPLNGSILFETNPQFVFQIIDILLGGAGNGKFRLKEFTEIEKNIIFQINKGLINNLKFAWDEIVPVDIEIEGIETNPAYNQTLAPNEPVALITFSAIIGNNKTFINICIPYISVEKVLDKLIIKYQSQDHTDETRKDAVSLLKNRLSLVDVTMTALLGSTFITVDDFLKLNTGDVISLDNKSASAVKLLVENVASYNGKPGIIGKNMGIQILDIINKDVENYE